MVAKPDHSYTGLHHLLLILDSIALISIPGDGEKFCRKTIFFLGAFGLKGVSKKIFLRRDIFFKPGRDQFTEFRSFAWSLFENSFFYNFLFFIYSNNKIYCKKNFETHVRLPVKNTQKFQILKVFAQKKQKAWIRDKKLSGVPKLFEVDNNAKYVQKSLLLVGPNPDRHSFTPAFCDYTLYAARICERSGDKSRLFELKFFLL